MGSIFLMEFILLGTMLFILGIFYWQTNSEAKYRDGKLFLVTIPKYAYETNEIQELIFGYTRLQRNWYLLFLLFILPMFLLQNLWCVGYFFSWLVGIIFLSYIPFKKYHRLLKEIKKQHAWPVEIDQGMHIDLTLSKYMEQMSIPIYWYTLPVGIYALTIILSIKWSQAIILATTLMESLALVIGLVCLYRISNKTYCDNSDINIQLNVLNKESINKSFLCFCLSNALFSLGIILLLYNKIPFILFVLILIIAMFLLIMSVSLLARCQRIKEQILFNLKGDVYRQDKDDYWQISIVGPIYNNPNDPRTMVPSPNGMQMTFNMAKPYCRYFIFITILVIIAFLGYLFGYPYYLDTRHQLAELTIESDTLVVDSPFYSKQWVIDDLVKVELTNDLGEGVRTNGTSTFVYDTGHYRYENYGEVRQYTASLHAPFIILYTEEDVYIVNDDEEDKTKNIYDYLNQEVNLK